MRPKLCNTTGKLASTNRRQPKTELTYEKARPLYWTSPNLICLPAHLEVWCPASPLSPRTTLKARSGCRMSAHEFRRLLTLPARHTSVRQTVTSGNPNGDPDLYQIRCLDTLGYETRPDCLRVSSNPEPAVAC